MISIAGIRHLAVCKKGTLTTTPTNVVISGLRNNGVLTIETFNDIKTVLNQSLRNMMNVNFESTTFQASLLTLKNLIECVKNGSDAQLITVPESGSGSANVFQFAGDNYPGLEFEFTITPKERSCKIILEFANHEADILGLITAALTNTPVDFSAEGTGKYLISNSKYVAPAFVSAKHNTVSLLPKDELKDYKLTIKTKDSGKTAYNRARVNYLSVSAEITGYDATISKINTLISQGDLEAVELKQKFDLSNDDTFSFLQTVLGRKEKINIADDDRSVTLTYEADISIHDVAFSGDVAGVPHNVTFG